MGKAFDEFKKITKQSLPFLFIAGIGELFAGLLLSSLIKNFSSPTYAKLIPGMLVLLPALMNLRGAISSSFAARLGSAYHLGLVRGSLFGKFFKNGMKGSVILAFISSVFVAIFAYFVSCYFGLTGISLVFFVFIAVSSSVLSALSLGVFTTLLTHLSIKNNIDPDNIMIPIITTVGDILLVLLAYLLMIVFVEVLL